MLQGTEHLNEIEHVIGPFELLFIIKNNAEGHNVDGLGHNEYEHFV